MVLITPPVRILRHSLTAGPGLRGRRTLHCSRTLYLPTAGLGRLYVVTTTRRRCRGWCVPRLAHQTRCVAPLFGNLQVYFYPGVLQVLTCTRVVLSPGLGDINFVLATCRIDASQEEDQRKDQIDIVS